MSSSRSAPILRRVSLALLGSLMAVPAVAQLRSGESVYRSVCIACHDTGVAHAPRKGDATAWKPLIAEGQHVLTGHAFVGVRAMPARGGDDKLSLEEFARAVAWMAREAGGHWQDPDVAMMRRIRHEAEKRLDAEILAKQKLKAHLRRQDQQRSSAR